MVNKEKVIRKAYGEHYDKCNPDKDGWTLRNYSGDNNINKDFSIMKELVGELFEYYHFVPMRGYSDAKFKFRPKSLEGIETNNDWKSIIEDGYPEIDYEDYFCIRKDSRRKGKNKTCFFC